MRKDIISILDEKQWQSAIVTSHIMFLDNTF